MALCRLMLNDFKHGDGDEYEKYPIGYDNYDLRCGLEWARDLLQQGIKTDWWNEIDLRTFIKWAKYKLRTGEQTQC
jgi:hypothetical protein